MLFVLQTYFINEWNKMKCLDGILVFNTVYCKFAHDRCNGINIQDEIKQWHMGHVAQFLVIFSFEACANFI